MGGCLTDFYRKLLLFSLLWLIGFGTGGAQDEPSDWIYRALQTDDGLPDNCVTGVVQSADGYLWVATRGGLMRFNGVDFVAQPLPALPGVVDRVVRAVFLDSRGRMWLGMERGPLICLGPEGAQAFGAAEGMPDSEVVGMAEDREGAVWVALAEGLCRIKDGRCTAFELPGSGPRRSRQTWVTSDAAGEIWFSKGKQLFVVREGKLQEKLVLEDLPVRICGAASGGLWIGAGRRVLKYEEGREPRELAQLPDAGGPRVVDEDRSGGLWIGTGSGGLFHLKDGVLEAVPTSHPEVDQVTEDREGNIWASTNGGGLNLIRARTVTLIGKEAGLPFESLKSVCQDASGGLWAVMQNGRLARSREGKWDEVGEPDGWPPEAMASCVTADQQGGVWVGTSNRGLRCLRDGVWQTWTRAEGLGGNSVRSILAARNGDVWIATDTPRRVQVLRGGQFTTMEMSGEVRSIRALTEGADGSIWVGTAEGQVLRVSGETLVRVIPADGEALQPIRSLHATSDGALWIGYAGYGVGRLKDGKFGRATTADGLLDDYASQLIADGRGGMWIAGNQGLSQVRLAKLTAVAEGGEERLRSRVFGRSHGLAGLQPSFDGSPSVWQTKNGRLLFAMRSGLLVVQPDRIHDDPDPPPVVVEGVSVDDQTVARYDDQLSLQSASDGMANLRDPAGVLRLPPDHRKLEFNFTALSFAAPENVHFRYQLTNFDKKWVEARTQRRASYPTLPAGRYEFRVIACNDAGVWNEIGATIPFEVAPFYWQTWWFRGLVLTFFTAGVIALARYVSFRQLRERMRQLEQQAALDKERARIARDMHDEVGAKLTRLSLLSDMAGGQPNLTPSAQEEVREISETARETILAFEEIVWAVNPRNDTLGDLAHYLCRYAEDFFDGSPTQCVFDLPKVIPPVMLNTEQRHEVFLAAKEALNNVMKHAKAGQVSVQLLLHPGAFELVIADDGCGFDPAAPDRRAGGGNGLTHMQDRIRGIAGRYECISTPGGTRISFHIPFA